MASQSVPVLVVISSSDDSLYDRYALAPHGIDPDTASALADRIIGEYKAANKDAWEFADIERALERLGFVFPLTVDCCEES